MRVQLIAYTVINQDIPGYTPHSTQVGYPYIKDADELAEQAGRLCYLSWERPNPKTATNEGYLANILLQGHFSVLEHASATFYIDGVSRSFLTELERHRHFSYSVVSQRYVDHGAKSDFKPVRPPKFSDEQWKTLQEHFKQSQMLYDEAVAANLASGMKIKDARGAARALLPESTETRLLLTGNMRCFREFLGKRLSPTAEPEIREVSKEILNWLKNLAPSTFQDMEIPSE